MLYQNKVHSDLLTKYRYTSSTVFNDFFMMPIFATMPYVRVCNFKATLSLGVYIVLCRLSHVDVHGEGLSELFHYF